MCARVISVFKCHKACPLTSSSAVSVAAFLKGSVVEKIVGDRTEGQKTVRIGHPSGVMTMVPELVFEGEQVNLPGVAVQRTARRIMEGTLYIRR